MEKVNIATKLIEDFNSILEVKWQPPENIKIELSKLLQDFQGQGIKPIEFRRKFLVGIINKKFRFNQYIFQGILDKCAKAGVLFNYHDKERIMGHIDGNDRISFLEWLNSKELDRALTQTLEKIFAPLSEVQTIDLLKAEILSSGKEDAILQALFSGYVFSCFDRKIMHTYFDIGTNDDQDYEYNDSFYDHLKIHYPNFFKRDSLILLVIDKSLVTKYKDLKVFKSSLFQMIKECYGKLSNHCTFAVQIKPISDGNDLNIQWELFSDIILYAEKFKEVKLEKKAYFKPKVIQNETREYIPELDLNKTKFELANEGFVYKDCFVTTNYSSNEYNLLLIFEKNERDETVIPCPACRSKNVQGNSYPIINVRSWECKNTFCPDKSKFNRGKRYSMASLIKQEAIEREENIIPLQSIRQWKLDVVRSVNDSDIIEMLIRHYSLYGDNILLINFEDIGIPQLGRNIIYNKYPIGNSISPIIYDSFYNSEYFHRFRIEKKRPNKKTYINLSSIELIELYNGDSYSVLQQLQDESIDGSVTSPPYYNAREYSQWKNIYCYLYDMYNIAREVYRVLKPGGIYLFNIFDYFDNENNIVFSAMGKKRMILGAYIIHLFKWVGFEIVDNIVWNKGEIEGFRNYNQGNFSPYYQAPFNCWEHIFVFSKGRLDLEKRNFPKILDARPVFKIIKGENTLGHSAPYPKEIPNLLLDILKPGDKVLDPFSGSMTTGRLAYFKGNKSVNIDNNLDYCKLGLKLLERDNKQIELFAK